MAKAGLLPLGRLLRINVPISSKRAPYFSKLEGGLQNIDLGISKSNVLLETDNGTFIYKFIWNTDTLHYFLSKYYNGSFTPGEEVIELLDKVFVDSLRRRLETRLPKISDYITIRTNG
jgi:hypothetical protein